MHFGKFPESHWVEMIKVALFYKSPPLHLCSIDSIQLFDDNRRVLKCKKKRTIWGFAVARGNKFDTLIR